MRRFLAVFGLMFGLSSAAQAQVIAYWNFNTTTSQATLFAPSGGVNSGTASMSTNFGAADVTNFGGSTVNAQSGDPAGQALALVNQAENGNFLQFQVSTTGFSNIGLSFATQRTATGFNSDQLFYSTDGTTFTAFGSPYTPPASFALQAFDLSSVTALNNAPTAIFRIVFSGASSAAGNNRIDNLVISPVPEPSTCTLVGVAAVGLGWIRRRARTAAA